MMQNTSLNLNAEIKNVQLNNSRANLEETMFPYIIFKIHHNTFALNCKYVQSIEPTPAQITEVSQASHEIRGVSYYKEQAINLIDLRRVLGMISQKDYARNVVDIPAKIMEHISFVERLEESLMNETEIIVDEDPYTSNLGKWIKSYKPLSSVVKNEIEHIVEPYELFHKTVLRIKDAVNINQKEEAHQLFDLIKNEYSQNVIERLNSLEKILTSELKEFSIIVNVGEKTVGLVVDETESVEPIDNIKRLPESVIVNDYIQNYGLRNKDNSILLILDPLPFA